MDTHEIDLDDPGDEDPARNDDEPGAAPEGLEPNDNIDSQVHENGGGHQEGKRRHARLDVHIRSTVSCHGACCGSHLTCKDSAAAGTSGGATDGAEDAQAKKMKITFEQFQKVTRALVMHLRQKEDSQPDGILLKNHFILLTEELFALACSIHCFPFFFPFSS